TQDLARICSLALQAGARVIGVGDTRQLPAVEAGGLFSLIARRHGHWKLTEVRRFEQAWERAASVRLGDGDVMALAEYAGRGRIWDGPQDRVYDDAVDLYMSDVARDKQALLLAGSNEEAARLAGPGRWSAPFAVPVPYLEQSAELAYAGNVYTSQGMTVDTARLVVSAGMNREMLYVGMTRGREENTAHVVTGPPDPAGMTRAERE